MKKTVHYLFCVALSLSNGAYANDIYIDVSTNDEIRISSTAIEGGQIISLQDSNPVTFSTSTTKSVNDLPYHREVGIAAKLTNIDAALIHAVIEVESGHQANVVSKKGAYGLMQLMPATALRFSVKNKQDTQQNIVAGARYLQELLTLFNDDVTLALAAYNAGPNTVKKYHHQIPPYAETKRYVPKVLKYYQLYSM